MLLKLIEHIKQLILTIGKQSKKQHLQMHYYRYRSDSEHSLKELIYNEIYFALVQLL